MGSVAVVSRMIRCGGLAAMVGAMLLVGGAACGQTYKQPAVVPTPQVPYSTTPVWATSFMYGDLDGDGKPDFMYLFTGSGDLYAGYGLDAPLFNNGGGAFLSPQTQTGTEFTPGVSVAQTIASVTKGGRPVQISALAYGEEAFVLVVPYTTSRIVDALGVKNSQFPPFGNKNPTITAMLAADLNGDGANDVVAEDSANNVLYVLLNDGTGNFTLVATIPLPGGSGQMLVGDFNLDGHPDIAVLGTNQQVYVLLGDGAGGTIGSRTYALSGPIYSMLYGDITGDGLADLVVEGTNGALSAFLGEAGTGPSETNLVGLSGGQVGAAGLGGHLIGIGDMNGDGIADIVTSTPTGIIVLEGTTEPNFQFSPGPAYNAGPGRTSYALADFDGDGHLDVAVDSPEGIAILYGDGNGGFKTGQTANPGQPAYSLALGQFSEAGPGVDAVVATGVPQIAIMSGDGTGNFGKGFGTWPGNAAETNAGRTVWSHVVTGDFNRDGHQDVVVGLDGPISVDLGPCCAYPASDDGISVVYGAGDGTFGTPQTIWPVANDPRYGAVAEADLFVAGIPTLLVFDIGNVVSYIGTSDDFAGDGPDFLFPSYADGKQHPYGQFALGQFTQGRAVWPDMVQQFPSASGPNFATVANYGGGSFTPDEITLAVPAGYVAPDLPTSMLPTTGMYVSAMALQDLDGDGLGDLEVLYHNLASNPANPSASAQNLLYIFWGNGVGSSGDGTFDPTPEILTLSRNYYEMAVGDVNGDGKQDLVLSDGYLVSVLAGDGTRSGFTSETHYLAGMGINQLVVQDVNGDGTPDIVVPNGGAVLSAGVVNRGVLASNAEVNAGGITVLLSNAGTTTPPTLGTVSGTVTAVPNPVPFGTDITFTANLTGSETTAPTGTVTFFAGSTQIGTAATLTSGSASSEYLYNPGVPPILNAGTYTITAQYSGDSVYAPMTLTGATPLVVQPVATTTTLQYVVSPIYYGQIIADQGIEETTPEPDGGTLDFLIDGVVACSLPLTSTGGTQYCPPSTGAGYDAGTYMVQSVYSGDQNFLTSSSPVYTVVVLPDPTSATLAASTGTSSTVGQAVTFTATIADAYTTARGTVNFFDGTTQIGTGTVNAQGQATYTTSALAVGTHSLSACLVASLDFLASSPCGTLSFTVNPVVTPPPPPPGSFTLTATPTSISVGVGNSVAVQVVVTALNGFSQPVQLGCSGLPFETTCTFAQSLIPGGDGSTVLMVSPSAPHNCGVSPPDFVAPNARGGMAGLLLSMLAMVGLRRRRRWVKGLALLVVLGALSGLSGCGTQCKDFGTEPTHYTFTITGTSVGSSPVSETVMMKMDVHL